MDQITINTNLLLKSFLHYSNSVLNFNVRWGFFMQSRVKKDFNFFCWQCLYVLNRSSTHLSSLVLCIIYSNNWCSSDNVLVPSASVIQFSTLCSEQYVGSLVRVMTEHFYVMLVYFFSQNQ